MNNIQTSNFPELDEFDSAKANEAIESFYQKYARILSETPLLSLHHKEYSKEGKRKKHVINAKLSSSKKSIHFEAFDWNFLTALQNTLKGLLKQLKSEK